MKKIFAIMSLVLFFSIFGVSSVFALGMTAGPVRILVDVGSSNSSSYGLINNGNETITVNLRVEGDAAQFIQIPATLDLIPSKLTAVDVKATIPSTYDGSLGGNVTGTIFAVQEGSPGQVQINIQASKTVQVLIPQYGGELTELKSQTQAANTQTAVEKTSVTGFSALLSQNSLLLIVTSVVVIIFLVFVVFTKRFEISIKQKEGVKN